MKKKIFAAALCTAMALSLTGAGAFGTASAAGSIPIDMYLIAGQSNAAGYSTANGISGTFGNVWYGGEVNRTLSGASAYSWLKFSQFKKSVTVGYGRQSGYIGPEFGIAEAINSYYSGEKKAFIFKSAAGGTSLKDRSDGEIATYGNWCPRSEWGTNRGATTGRQYEAFINNFSKVYGELKAKGYAPKVRGMFWMQGEADIAEPALYESLIKKFIPEIRTELSAIAEDDLAAMPFFMGEVSTSFGTLNNQYAPAFIAMQRRVAQDVEEVYTVFTGDLPIRDEQGNIVGTDQYHWSGKDMRTLGNRAGEAMYEAAFSSSPVRVTREGTGSGEVTFAEKDGKIEFTVTPSEGSRLSFFSVDGVNVTDKISDGKYTAEPPEEGEKLAVRVVFEKLRTLKIEYEYDENMAEVSGADSVSEAETLSVTVTPKEGYEIVSVEFVGKAASRVIPLEYNEETGKYELSGIGRDGTVRVSARAAGSSGISGGSGGTESGSTAKKGCGGTICTGAALLALAALLFAVKSPRR